MLHQTKLLNRRSAIALAGGVAAGVLPILGGSAHAAVVPYFGAREETKRSEAFSSVEDLMRQHGVQRRILAVYAELAQRLHAGEEGDIDTIALMRAATLFREFGQDYHERMLEEAYVFPDLRSGHGPNEKLVEVLMQQHQRGREINDYLYEVASRGTIAGLSKPLGEGLTSMVRMYNAHTAWEDTVVFPAWKAMHSEESLGEIAGKFRDIERRQFGEDGLKDAVASISKIEHEVGIGDVAAFTAQPPPTA